MSEHRFCRVFGRQVRQNRLSAEGHFHLALTPAAGTGKIAGSMTMLPSAIAVPDCRPLAVPASQALRAFAAEGDSRAEQHAFCFGRSYDSYLVTEAGWEHFWSSGRRGMIAVARQGRHLFCGGGLLAPAEHQEELLRQFVVHALDQGRTMTFLNICEGQLPLFRDCGFQATKWGEEAIVDLPDCDWSGKSYAWVRRQTNFCRRQGLEWFECHRDEHSATQWSRLAAELTQVSEAFLAGKPQSQEMRLLQAPFDPRRLGRKRLFAARRRPSGRIEGFLACNPCDNGRTWVMETCRQRPDAVRGTIPFLMHQAMSQLQAEGVRHVSLCLLPGLRCREPLPGDSAMVRWGLALGTGPLDPAYAVAGAHHFKSRFRPRFENRYLCVLPRATFGSAVAFIRLVGALRFDPRKLIGLAWTRWRKRAARATLLTPEET